MTDGSMVDWRLTALDDLLAIDRFRKRLLLPPIRGALYRAIESYFEAYIDPRMPVPGKPVTNSDLPSGLRLTRIYIGSTGGPYRVMFRFDSHERLFEILRVAHPRENRKRS